ncbi:hypothetical protein F5884DRAFT_751466 [Xylogone sp. PMI_703]|nr:hypothetical protein F5884DRAFT_751466 [Xylogone sp. PMI_703]
MYKWHVHSAIGRGRPLASDLARVTDGIAASLRQFSISASKASEEQEQPRISRAQRSANAAAEVSSLPASRPRGIDARALGAAPAQGFTITRVDPTSTRGNRNQTISNRGGRIVNRSKIVGRGAGAAGTRGRSGGAIRGRGRGTGKNIGSRGNRSGTKKRRGPIVKRDQEEDFDEPYNAEELAFLDSAEQGVKHDYVPTTAPESLQKQGPPVATSSAPRGLAESIAYRMQILTDSFPTNGAYVHPKKRMAQYNKNGVFFENIEERQRLEALGKKFDSISDAEKSAILNALVAGNYVVPKATGDIASHVASYLTHNETYLPADKTHLVEKLKSLLPAQQPQANKAKPTAKPA